MRHQTPLGSSRLGETGLEIGAVDSAIVGVRRSDQVDAIIAAANAELGEDDVANIEGRA
jgi:aryl-alcohol dehydrogenase-like predicted oxidoreductase